MIIGYCRVSTDGQTLDAQVAELKAADAIRIFSEKQSAGQPHGHDPGLGLGAARAPQSW
jgi:DNA invertase Pin-like site-specific DNA recombinase